MPLTRIITFPLRDKHFAYASLALITYWLLMLWGSGYYLLIFPLLTDISIPLNAAVAWRDGIPLHSDFRSPLGLFYFIQHGWALAIVEFFFTDYSLFAVLTTAHVLLLLMFFALMWLTHRFLNVIYPLWLPLLISLAVMANGLHAISWYEAYNIYLFNLYLLCVFILWQRYTRKHKKGDVAETVMLSLLFVFAALYKINYAAAFLALFAVKIGIILTADLPQWSNTAIKRSGKLTVLFVISAAGFLAAAAVLFGYDISGYIDDLHLAANAKQHPTAYNYEKYIRITSVLLPFALISYVLSLTLLRYPYHWFNILIWWGGVWLSAAICLIGTSTTLPAIAYAVVFLGTSGAYLHWRQLPRLLRGSAATAAAITLAWLLLLNGWQLQIKITDGESILSGNDYFIYDAPQFNFVAPKTNTVTLSHLKLSPAGAARAEYPSGSLFTERTHEVGQILQRWKNAIHDPRITFMTLENFSLFFYDNPPPTPLLHWKDINVNITPSDTTLLEQELQASNIVLLPAYYSVPQYAYFSCWFLYKADEARLFEYTDTTQQWHVFIRRSVLTRTRNIAPVVPFTQLVQQPELKQQCNNIFSGRRHPLIWSMINMFI